MVRIDAEAFLRAWHESLDSELAEEIARGYEIESRLNEIILEGESSVLRRVRDRLVQRFGVELEFVPERYTVDASLFAGQGFHCEPTRRFPSEVHVLIEHEASAWPVEEFWKLSRLRAPLKVIIFYGFEPGQKQSKTIDAFWDKCREFLELEAAHWPEAPGTEYLFLVGSRREVGGNVEWRSDLIVVSGGVTRRSLELPNSTRT